MGSSVRPEPSWLADYLTTPADNTGVKRAAPPYQPTIGPSVPGSRQPNTLDKVYSTLEGSTPKSALAGMLFAPLGALQAGMATGRAAQNHDVGGTALQLAAAMPMLIPGGSLERAAGKAARAAFKEVPHAAFETAVSDFAKARPSEAGFLTQRTADQMKSENMRTFLSANGKSGYALAPLGDGQVDIRNVFNHGEKGAGAQALAHALSNGGNVLDHFDTKLGDLYRDFGFKEYTPPGEAGPRLSFSDEYAPEGWDFEKHGRPDVVYQQHPQGGQLTPGEYMAQYALTKAARTAPKEGSFLAPYIHTADPDAWKPVERGVFDRSGNAGDYREPAPLPFDVKAGPRAGVDPLAARIGEDPKVESTLLGDVLKGVNQGGRSWYGLKPVRDSYEAMDGPLSFKDFNFAGGAGSIRTPTHNELTNASILMYAKAHGITPTEAKAEFLKQFPNSMRPTFMDQGAHAKGFARAQERGVYAPVSETDAALKVPSYVHDRMLGANGIALDTHERRRIAQSLGIGEDEVSAALDRNGMSYMAGTQPYHRIAMNLGLHPDQVQASRWLGGGLMTGLESQPKGDFLQTLEDGLLYTAKTRGLGTSPKDLSALWKRIAQGKDFFMPTSAKGGFPVY